MDTISQKKVHHGRSVKRLREILGVKQEAIAVELDVTQPYVSELEQKDVIDDKVLEKIAKILNVSVDTIKNFNEESAIYNIQHNYDGSNPNVGNVAVQNMNCSFNPIEKISTHQELD